MEQMKKQETKSPIVREYKIGDITYIVKAVVKDGVREDAATKVRRLIHNDLKREKSPVYCRNYSPIADGRRVMWYNIYNLFVRLSE